MSATLDQLLAKSMQLAGAPVLFVARQPIHYQKGCGVGRRQFQERVLLIHATDTDHTGTWSLPTLDVAPDVEMDAPVPFGDVLLARCDAEFKPSIDENNYDTTWTCVDYAVACANDPQATTAIRKFLATQGDSKSQHGEPIMESRISPRDAQLRAQRVYEAFGDAEGAPAILNGESGIEHRIRLLSKFKQHSKSYKDADLTKIQDETVFAAVENAIYTDALQEAEHPTKYKLGVLDYITRADAAGRPITKAAPWSDPNACWNQFAPRIRLAKILVPGRVA